MGFFKSKDEKARSRQIAREKAAIYEGESMQIIGKIPKGATVKLTLRPEDRVLNMHYQATDITLPYERILGFDIENESSDTTSKGMEMAKSFFSRGNSVGQIVGNLIPRTKFVKTIAHLKYIDKADETKELCFFRSHECEYDNFEPDNEEDSWTKEFAKVIESIVIEYGEEITEL